MTDVAWKVWSRYLWLCLRLVGIALVGLFHECLNAGFDSVLHLLYHLLRIEG